MSAGKILSLLPTYFSPNFYMIFFFNFHTHIVLPVCARVQYYLLECGYFLRDACLKKTASFSHSSLQSPITFQIGLNFMSSCPPSVVIVTDLILRSYPCSQSFCEFMGVMTLLCPENNVSKWTSTISITVFPPHIP